MVAVERRCIGRGGRRLTGQAFDFDAVVAGAGAVGLGCAYALARRGLDVLVMEAREAIGQGVSARSSEVIHAGLYYPTDTLRARLCVAGRRALYDFLQSHGVAHRRCEKLVVASAADEGARLEAVFAQARINGVEEISMIDGAAARRLEPQLSAEAAILSRTSGVFDSAGYLLALRGEIEAAGGAIALGAPLAFAVQRVGGGFEVRAGGAAPAVVSTRRLVLAPGLGAQETAARVEGYPLAVIPQRRLGKGVFYRLHGPSPFERLIYPVPIPGALGTHYRQDIWGQALFGPDLCYVEQEDYSVGPEREASVREAVARFWPGVAGATLSPDYAGIRPKIHGPDEPQPDFRLDGSETHALDGLLALFGMESPGLTASLAIGEEVAARLGL
ncbi:MAG TPA: NAD(P)/FAD-dependent oxidoreductase [Caulobacteraceae bacterium]|nr:NAD(P)/FAD-dependent oxidoreductase [Caulobacteraceae bacterium]